MVVLLFPSRPKPRNENEHASNRHEGGEWELCLSPTWLATRETRVPVACGWLWLLGDAAASVETAIGVSVLLRLCILLREWLYIGSEATFGRLAIGPG